MKLRVLIATAVVGAIVALSTMGSATADLGSSGSHGGAGLTAVMTGEQEVPGPGDPDGTGVAHITLNQGLGEVCWDITVSGITLPATAAHIHEAPAGIAGDIVVTLSPPDETGTASGCATDVDRSLIKDIRKNPSEYYVNVHTTDFPSGAIRGQLSK